MATARISFIVKKIFSLNVFIFEKNINFAAAIQKANLSDGVIGNTSDFGSEESRFETWSDNFPLNQFCFIRNYISREL